MSLTIGREATLELDLTMGGRSVSVSSAASVTAQLLASDGTALSGAIPVLPNAIGADWLSGYIVINFLAADTVRVTEESVEVLVIVNEAGTVQEWRLAVLVDSAADNYSLLFERGAAFQFMRANHLLLAASTYGVLNSVSDDGLWLAIKTAEAQAGRALAIPLVPTEIFTEEASLADIDALNGRPYLVEPGYDMPPDFFSTNMWGSLSLRVTPVIEIKRMDFVYPSQGGAVFTVPNNWIRIDKKYGHLHIFPSAQVVSAPLSIFMLQAMSSGSNIPHMIRVRYTAGLQNVENNYPEVLTLVYQMAALNVLRNALFPQSGSVSADGLSQTISLDTAKLQDSVYESLALLQQQLIGPLYTRF